MPILNWKGKHLADPEPGSLSIDSIKPLNSGYLKWTPIFRRVSIITFYDLAFSELNKLDLMCLHIQLAMLEEIGD